MIAGYFGRAIASTFTRGVVNTIMVLPDFPWVDFLVWRLSSPRKANTRDIDVYRHVLGLLEPRRPDGIEHRQASGGCLSHPSHRRDVAMPGMRRYRPSSGSRRRMHVAPSGQRTRKGIRSLFSLPLRASIRHVQRVKPTAQRMREILNSPIPLFSFPPPVTR